MLPVIGYVNKFILKKLSSWALLVGFRNFEVIELPVVGDVITTRVEVKEEVFGMTLAEATIVCGDKLLAKSEMKIAIKERNE